MAASNDSEYDCKYSESASSSKDLLYCEYVDAKESIIEKLLQKDRKCPDFKFERSSVLDRVKSFIPELQKAQDELQLKSPHEYNIEEVDENSPVIEFDIGLVENPNPAFALLCDDCSGGSEEEEEDDDDSEEESKEEEVDDDSNILSDDKIYGSNDSENSDEHPGHCLIEVLPDKCEKEGT